MLSVPPAGAEGAGAGGQEREQGIQEQEWGPCIEDQEHLECCPGYAKLWEGLAPATEESRVKYFMQVKLKRLKQQQSQNSKRGEN